MLMALTLGLLGQAALDAAAPIEGQRPCFVVLSDMRSGSTALIGQLAHRLSNVRVYGELFHKYKAYYSADVDEQLSEYSRPDWVNEWEPSPKRYANVSSFLNSVCNDETAQQHAATGFKFLGFQRKWASGCAENLGCDWTQPLRERLIRNPAIKKIVLERTNKTAQYVSFLRASKTGDFKHGHSAEHVSYSQEMLDHWEREQHEFFDAVRDDLRATGQQALELTYEDDFADEAKQEATIARTALFLGVSVAASPASGKPTAVDLAQHESLVLAPTQMYTLG